MAILVRGHYRWIVAGVCWCIAGCEQAQPVATAPESVSGGGNASERASFMEPQSVDSSPQRSMSVAAPEAGSAGSMSMSAGASGSKSPSTGASGSSGASTEAGVAAGTGASGSSAVMPDVPESDACVVREGTAAAPGFVGDWVAGTYPENFASANAGNYLTISGLPNQGNMDRQYAVHVPLGYDHGTPLPALFCLHAFSMNARSFCLDMAGWPAKADKEKFIVIMPNGYQNSWNIGEGCGAALLPVHTEGIDDVGFVRALLDEVGKHVNIDLGRVYAAGFSNGSSLAWRLACDASDIFTAVVPVAAGSCLRECKPSHKVSLLDVYGTADAFNPTEDLAASMAAIQEVSGCAGPMEPATVPMMAGAANCQTSTGCASGECSTIEVTQCVVRDGSHCWFGNMSTADCGAGMADDEFFMTNLAWEFLRRLSR